MMNEVKIDKVIVNMGVGAEESQMKKAILVMQTINGKKGVTTNCKVRIPDWGLRPGIPIGLKLTLRRAEATDFLKRAFVAKENKMNAKSFDREGNFAFGVREHINMPGVKYDPKLGIMGFDVIVALKKRGFRVKERKIKQTRVGKKQRITKEEAITFVKSFGVDVQ